VVLAEYRGYGGNPGRPSEAALQRDGVALLDALRLRDVPPARIVVYGESLGSGVALHLASAERFAAVVIEGGFSSLSEVAQHHYPWLPVRPFILDRFDNLARIGAVDAPILILHGLDDEVVPVRLARRLYDAAPEPKALALLPGVGHNDLYIRGGIERVLGFLSKTPGLGEP
jgi:fermentation-respiration switch protein FrsA (DUF1100 family)